MLLDRQMKAKINEEVVQLLLSIISGVGGFRVLIEGRSVKSLLRELRRMDVALRYVVEIVRYLVRCQLHGGNPGRATIEDAKASFGYRRSN